MVLAAVPQKPKLMLMLMPMLPQMPRLMAKRPCICTSNECLDLSAYARHDRILL